MAAAHAKGLFVSHTGSMLARGNAQLILARVQRAASLSAQHASGRAPARHGSFMRSLDVVPAASFSVVGGRSRQVPVIMQRRIPRCSYM